MAISPGEKDYVSGTHDIQITGVFEELQDGKGIL
jgi:hypothetical protein